MDRDKAAENRTQRTGESSNSREHGATSKESKLPSPSSDLPAPSSSLPAPSSSLPTPGSELQALSALAEKLVEKNPRSLPHRTFLALARLKQNRAADALAVYENIAIARGALTPSALALHAAVLAANGKTEEAKSEVEQIKIDNLLPEERTLVEQLTKTNH